MSLSSKQDRSDTATPVAFEGLLRESPFDPRVVLGAALSAGIWISTTVGLTDGILWAIGLAAVLVGLRKRLARSVAIWRRFLLWALVASGVTIGLYYLIGWAQAAEYLPGGESNLSDWRTGAQMGARLFAFTLLGLTIASLSSPLHLALGLTRLLYPLRRFGAPIETIFYFVFFLFRMLPFLAAESRTIRYAQAARGIRFDGGLRGRSRAAASLVVPVFAAAGRRAERLALALWARGFDVRRLPRVIGLLRFAPRDFLFSAVLFFGWFAWWWGRPAISLMAGE
jgi:energy-coupling factor transporter transmembrane protein EcfT